MTRTEPVAALRPALLGLFAAGLATFALLYAPQPLLPQIAEEYSLTPAVATLALSVTTGALALGVIPVSWLADRTDRRRVMVLALAVAGVLGLLAPAMPWWPLLLVVRGVQGVALAAVPGTAVAYATEIAGRERAGIASGLYIAGTTVGGMAGRVLGGIFGDLLGWREGTGAVAVVAVLAAGAAAVLLPAQPASARTPVERTGRTWDGRQVRLCVLAFLLMAAFVGTYNTLAFRLGAAPYDLSQTAIGLVFLAYLAGTVSSSAAGRLADVTSRRTIMAVSVLVLAAGAVIALARPLPLVIVGIVVLTAGFFGTHGVASGWVSAAAPGGHRGLAAARYTICYYAGSTAGGPEGAAAFSHGGWSATTTLVLVLAAGVLVLVLTLPPGRTHRRVADPTAQSGA